MLSASGDDGGKQLLEAASKSTELVVLASPMAEPALLTRSFFSSQPSVHGHVGQHHVVHEPAMLLVEVRC